ncbi:MAG: Hpt domain-containing protein [Acidimicrobiia bacterium]|nr:Hpt domain-containing protein [Acidimicrobiia bacterium]
MEADPNDASVDGNGAGARPVDTLQYATFEAMGAALEVDDLELMASLVQMFLVDLADGRRVIVSATRINDADAVQAAAHKLKSSARMLGAPALGDLAEEIEAIARNGFTPDVDLLARFGAECGRATEGMTLMKPFEVAS